MTTENLNSRSKEFTENFYDIANDNTTPLARTTLSGTHNAYYRSKLLTIDTDINPLISAAAPLFAIASALRNTLAAPDLNQLFQDLCHEVKAFENKLQSHHYRSPIILAARYALCALLDEIIISSNWQDKIIWKNHNLLNVFQRESWGGEKFFVILERSCEDPAIHIDLLELLYVCLSLGFEGKYQGIEKGHLQLTEVMDNLYEIIKQQRGEFSQKLFLQTSQTTTQQKKSPKSLLLSLLTVLLSMLTLAIVYGSLNYLLNGRAKMLYQEFNQFKKANAYSSETFLRDPWNA